MRGQLKFDEFMNIMEEKTPLKTEKTRVQMVDPCYYCLCNSCVKNAENINTKLEEIKDNEEFCFFCDECVMYDSENIKNMERKMCNIYCIDNYHAMRNREKLRIL